MQQTAKIHNNNGGAMTGSSRCATDASEDGEILEKEFQRTPYPGDERRGRLAAALGATDTQIQVWFSKRRARARREANGGAQRAARGAAAGHYQSVVRAIGNAAQQQQQQQRQGGSGGKAKRRTGRNGAGSAQQPQAPAASARYENDDDLPRIVGDEPGERERQEINARAQPPRLD